MEEYNKKQLIDTCNKITNNIDRNGLWRYDRSDIKWFPGLNYKHSLIKIIRKGVLVVDSFFPVTIRRFFKIEKTIPPTTYTHLSNSYLIAEKFSIQINKIQSSTDIAELCIDHYCVQKKGKVWWNPSLPKTTLPLLKDDFSMKRPTMNMHSMARCNILLLDLYRQYKVDKYLDIAYNSLIFTIENHKITHHENGSISINYYYDTDDCTINVNSEFAHWVSMLPIEKITPLIKTIFNGVIKLITTEQQKDGSWSYYSAEHHRDNNILLSFDCHHTGTILNNLLNIIKSDIVDQSTMYEIIQSINKGMTFYVENFFNSNSGKAKTLIGYIRPAGPVQYSEAIFSFCEYLSSTVKLDESVKEKIRLLMPKVVSQVASFVNEDGSVPSEKVIKWINIDSIRWGNGPVLQALLMYISINNDNFKKR